MRTALDLAVEAQCSSLWHGGEVEMDGRGPATVPLRNFFTNAAGRHGRVETSQLGYGTPASGRPVLPCHLPARRAPGQSVAGLLNCVGAALI